MPLPSVPPLTDTTPEAAAVQQAAYQRMDCGTKLRLVDELTTMTQQLALAGLKQRFPDATPQQLFRKLVSLRLGEELATLAYGEAGDDPVS